MSLPAYLVNGLVALGIRLLKEHIASEEDTTEIEAAIINAQSRDEIKAILKRELLDILADQFMTDTDIPEDVTESLAGAKSKEAIVSVLNETAARKSFFNSLWSLVNCIGGLMFSKSPTTSTNGENS